MDHPDLKTAAESVLRELPAVVGVFVRPDAFGHPREIHLLIGPGPKPREFAEHVKAVLEDRLRIPIDQRIISIAQVADAPATTAPEPEPQVLPAVQERVRLDHVESSTIEGRVTVRARLLTGAHEFEGEATELESGSGRSRAAARAVLAACDRLTEAGGRFSLEFAILVAGTEADYILCSATVSAQRLGRRSERVFGAHPIEDQVETAAALATLKAVNRLLSFLLNGQAARSPRARIRP
ncbi:MAG: hypothetical protein L0271_03025 [Gemmatimonadetes bacterium]|nr:hypothetical protein [Gemmatimonadota bacterium]